MIFSYEAKDSAGHVITGSLEAQNERTAARQVHAMGYFLMRLTARPAAAGGSGAVPAGTAWPASSASPNAWAGTDAFVPSRTVMSPGRWLLVHIVYAVWSGVSLRDMALLYRQFATLVNAGVPILESLTALIAQTRNGVLHRCLQTISLHVRSGGMLSEGMAVYPWIFTDFHRAMVSAGEHSGRLDLMFARLSDALEQEYTLRNNIKREMFYPGFTFVASFLLPPIVLVVVQHNLRGYFLQAILPLLECVGVMLGLFVITRLASQVKTSYDAVISVLPGVGGAVRMVALARFSRTLASLYAAGVAIPEALRASAVACGNAYLGGRIQQAVPQLMMGQGIAESLSLTGVFPPLVVSMLATGEATGSLDQTMNKAAEYYEQEAAIRLHQLSVSLGVAVTIFIGIKVAIIVIGFYKGYFNSLLAPDAG